MFARFLKLLRPALIIGTLPATLTNGTTADATQVMADLNWIVNQVNANAAAAANVALLTAANSFTMVQSGVNAAAAANFPITSQVQGGAFNTLTSTLGTNTISSRVIAFPLAAYAVNQRFTGIASQTNTGPVSLNIDTLGSIAVQQKGAELLGGELRQGAPFEVMNDGSSKFQLVGDYPAKGNWAPSLAFGGGTTGLTYSIQYGHWQASDKLLSFQGRLTVTSKGSSTGLAQVKGLPFNSLNSAISTPVSMMTFGIAATGNGTSSTPVMGQIATLSSSIDLFNYQGGSPGTFNDTFITNSTIITMAGQYEMN